MMNNNVITSLKIYKIRKEEIIHKEVIKSIITTKNDIRIACITKKSKNTNDCKKS